MKYLPGLLIVLPEALMDSHFTEMDREMLQLTQFRRGIASPTYLLELIRSRFATKQKGKVQLKNQIQLSSP